LPPEAGPALPQSPGQAGVPCALASATGDRRTSRQPPLRRAVDRPLPRDPFRTLTRADLVAPGALAVAPLASLPAPACRAFIRPHPPDTPAPSVSLRLQTIGHRPLPKNLWASIPRSVDTPARPVRACNPGRAALPLRFLHGAPSARRMPDRLLPKEE
jgi:hypothetical protein